MRRASGALADWTIGPPTMLSNAISHPHRADWFFTDELHFANIDSGADRHPAGADAYAAAIADGVSRCAPG